MKIGLLCILFSYLALSVGSAIHESLTYDEVFYLEEGRRILETRTFFDPYNPPLASLLTTVPMVMGWTEPVAGRLVTVGFGMLLILAVYRVGGLVAALLLAFDPTVLAHSHYVTNDIALTLFVFLSTVAWQRCLVKPTRMRILLVGLGVGYALATKMTAIPYLGITFVAAWWWQRPRRGWQWFTTHRRGLLGSVIVALLVLWASYLFTWDVLIREREDPGRVSTRLVAYAREHNLPALESAMMFLMQQPLPLGTYAATIKNNILRVGKSSMWYFMIINFLRKTPIPLLIMIGIGLWYQKNTRVRMALVSGVGMILFASFIGMAPLVRYVLPAMPFLALVAAAGIRGLGKIIISVLLLWYVVGTIAQYPHFISYANELAGLREGRFEVLADSNLDWGQALPDLARYVTREKFGKVKFSYFGRDNAAAYGLPSVTPYGSWRFEDICAFHDVMLDEKLKEARTIISVSNWYYCGYYKEEAFRKEKIRDVVSDVFLVF